MSVYDLISTALLLFLALPLVAVTCKVAVDLPLAGAALTNGVALATCGLYRHAGSRLVDVTLAVLAICTVVLLIATAIGLTRRRTRAPVLPIARVRRD